MIFNTIPILNSFLMKDTGIYSPWHDAQLYTFADFVQLIPTSWCFNSQFSKLLVWFDLEWNSVTPMLGETALYSSQHICVMVTLICEVQIMTYYRSLSCYVYDLYIHIFMTINNKHHFDWCDCVKLRNISVIWPT